MKVKELIEILESIKDQDRDIILSSDSEGNSYFHLTEEGIDPLAYCSVREFENYHIDGLTHPDDLEEDEEY